MKQQDKMWLGCMGGFALGFLAGPGLLMLSLQAIGSKDAGGPLFWLLFTVLCAFCGGLVGLAIPALVGLFKRRK